jgi:hypothetical protein
MFEGGSLSASHRPARLRTNIDEVGMKFVEGSGFARWADTNKFVVLFPQVSASLIKNPKGCWDWWGYSGSDYLTKDAPQIAAIWSMVDRLSMTASQASAQRPSTTMRWLASTWPEEKANSREWPAGSPLAQMHATVA